MIIYLFSILLIGIIYSKHTSINDYMFSSRKVTIPSFIATFVTTWYGGILEIGRFTFYNGIVTWFIFGFFYYISAFLFLKLFSSKIHKNNIDSIPGYFHKYLGNRSGFFASIIVLLLSSPAPYLMIFSTIFIHVYNIPFNYAVLIGMLFSVSYLILGGFRSIIRTDKIQFVLMYLGFVVVFFHLYSNYGGISFLQNNLPANHLSPFSKLPVGYILSWSVISMITFIDPNIYQRIYVAKDKKTIKSGVLISIFFWIVFDFLTVAVGLYAAAIIPTSELSGSPYLILSNMILPPFLQILFIISLLSIVMSTIDSFTFTSAITIAKEFKKGKTTVTDIRIGLFITCIASFVIVTNFKNVIDIWYLFGSLGASSLLVPFFMLINKPKIKAKDPLKILLIPFTVCGLWFYMNNPYGIDCLYIGISVSLFMNFYSFQTKHS